jgi:hypothetical protein
MNQNLLGRLKTVKVCSHIYAAVKVSGCGT